MTGVDGGDGVLAGARAGVRDGVPAGLLDVCDCDRGTTGCVWTLCALPLTGREAACEALSASGIVATEANEDAAFNSARTSRVRASQSGSGIGGESAPAFAKASAPSFPGVPACALTHLNSTYRHQSGIV